MSNHPELDAFEEINRILTWHQLEIFSEIYIHQLKATRELNSKLATKEGYEAVKAEIKDFTVERLQHFLAEENEEHAALQGTTRPTHYHVLHDEIGFSPDDLQELVHSLSYVYQRSTTAISLVAPVCYAHLAASQVGQFMKFEEMSETSSSHNGVSSAGAVPVPQLPKLHDKRYHAEIRPLCNLLRINTDSFVRSKTLDTLSTILSAAEDTEKDLYVKKIAGEGGWDRIKELRKHQDSAISHNAKQIVERFYGVQFLTAVAPYLTVVCPFLIVVAVNLLPLPVGNPAKKIQALFKGSVKFIKDAAAAA